MVEIYISKGKQGGGMNGELKQFFAECMNNWEKSTFKLKKCHSICFARDVGIAQMLPTLTRSVFYW